MIFNLKFSLLLRGKIQYCCNSCEPNDLKTRERTGNSRQIEMYFSIQTTKFLMKYNLPCFQISGRLTIFFTKHAHQVSTSYIKENRRYSD